MTRITPEIERIIDRALDEDLSLGDATTDALIPPELKGRAVVVAEADCVLAGIDVALSVFRRVDSRLHTEASCKTGNLLGTGDVVARIEGPVASVLKAERTALNLLQRLSGIATETDRYVRAVAGHKARIIDTRKTTPGLRVLEKDAIRAGGGFNHRRNLGDGILIKDNHIQALKACGMTIGEVVKLARRRASHMLKVEVEVEDLDQVREALEAGAEVLLLDNMDVELMELAVKMAEGKAVTEASGGITLETVKDVAATGVDLISVGALTHSVRAINMSLDLK